MRRKEKVHSIKLLNLKTMIPLCRHKKNGYGKLSTLAENEEDVTCKKCIKKLNIQRRILDRIFKGG